MHNLKELKIWNKAMDLSVDIYRQQLIISNNLRLKEIETLQPLLKQIEEVQKMNHTFQNSLQIKLQSKRDMEISASQA